MAKNLGNLFIDGESVIEDETNNHSITNNGVTINTDIKNFGVSSLEFDNASDLVIPATSDFQFGLGDFTIDFWINFKGSAAANYHIIEQNEGGTRWQFWRDGGVWRFYTSGVDFEVEDTLSIETWYHVSLVRHGGVFRIYRDGILLKEVTNEISTAIPTFLGSLYIGSYVSGANYLNSYLDNVRLVKGTALWTENFNLDEESLFYKDPIAIPTSNIYHTKRTKMRGKAAEGFIRPTIAEFFTSKDFEEVGKIPICTGYGDNLAITPANCSASSQYGANEAANAINTKLVFNDGGNWYSIGPTCVNEWWKYDFGTNTRIEKYTLQAGVDSGIETLAFHEWKFQGSNDNSSWTDIDTQSGQYWDEAQIREFEIINTNSYQYYRFFIANNEGSLRASMAIIKMMEGTYE